VGDKFVPVCPCIAEQGKWQLPGAFVFLDAISRTSVGKFKLALHEQFATGSGSANSKRGAVEIKAPRKWHAL
jgi:hypothetical protein